MADLKERLDKALKDVEEAKKKAASLFKYNSEQIEMILGRAERSIQRGALDKVFGYGSEISGHAKKIDEVFDQVSDLMKDAKTAESDQDSDEDIFEDSLQSLEKNIKDFMAEHKLARDDDDPMRYIVRRTMQRLKI